jgi:hypothetical protein
VVAKERRVHDVSFSGIDHSLDSIVTMLTQSRELVISLRSLVREDLRRELPPNEELINV